MQQRTGNGDATAGAEDARPVRERILRATLRLVADEGVDAVTHRAVAARAGVSPGSTTHHFSSRLDLLEEAFRYYLREGEAMVRLLMEQARRGDDRVETLVAQLRTAIDPSFNYGLTRAEYELLLFAVDRPELAAEVLSWEQAMVGVLAAQLERVGVAKPMSSARALYHLIRGFELERLLDPRLGADDFEERIGPVLRGLVAISAE